MAGTWDWGIGELTACTKALRKGSLGEFDILLGKWNFIDWEWINKNSYQRSQRVERALGERGCSGRDSLSTIHSSFFVRLSAFCPGCPSPSNACTQHLVWRAPLSIWGSRSWHVLLRLWARTSVVTATQGFELPEHLVKQYLLLETDSFCGLSGELDKW